MNVGVVAQWFNRGQGTVARHLRSALISLGYETFVLARPARERFIRPGLVQNDDVWQQEGVTFASRHEIPLREYEHWVYQNELDVVFFDQNYQFDEIYVLRKRGIRTIGRFVWESFSEKHVEGARASLDVIYSLTKCEQARYRMFGIDSPRLQWGCHPELLEVPPRVTSSDTLRLYYPGGYLSKRKPTGAVVKAFQQVEVPNLQLIIKSQRHLRASDLIIPECHQDLSAGRKEAPDERVAAALEAQDDRIRVVTDDLATEAHYDLFRSADVCLAPSRWEGLGLHLYEATAFGLPLVLNDIPPLNEITRHQENGLLVDSFRIGNTKSGIPSWEPRVDSLREAIEFLTDPGRLDSLRAGVKQTRQQLDWMRTLKDLEALLECTAQGR